MEDGHGSLFVAAFFQITNLSFQPEGRNLIDGHVIAMHGRKKTPQV
jgi:hypothetical protein